MGYAVLRKKAHFDCFSKILRPSFACPTLRRLMNHQSNLSRRTFLTRTALASSAAALWPGSLFSSLAAEAFNPPVAVFSKVYQELKLDFEAGAAVTAQAGLDGIDCPVRPGGEILPERAADDMPRYAEALRRHQVRMLLITTGILEVSSPHAEAILRTAKQLGVQYYRLGSSRHATGKPLAPQLADVKAKLKDLAALNRELGVCALFQNHSPGRQQYFGGELNELYELVNDFNPDQIGVAFDLGHALIVHGDEWTTHFERLKPHLQVAYIKDVKLPRSFVPFGEGEFKNTDYFTRLKKMGYRHPFSLHIEFEWAGEGKPKTRAGLVKTLRDNLQVLKQWVAKA